MSMSVIKPKIFLALGLLLGLSAIFLGCEGPPGADGLAGVDGADANESCTNCHRNDTQLFARQLQWEASVHATGGNFERNGTDCAPCHTSEGFLEVLETGAEVTVAAIENPSPPNCRTCHQIHTNYDSTDYALTTQADVTPLIDPSATISIGTGNLCASCHQSRAADIPAVVATITDSISVTSTRYGPHHGPQSNLLAGVAAGWEVVGSKAYANSVHTNLTDGCVTCHMADAYGAQAGGHTMALSYDYHGSDRLNDAGCVACHTDADDEIDALTTELEPLIADIESLLLARGVLDSTGYAVPGKMNAIEAGALFNYRMVALEDRSMGAHNPKYVVALLTNTKEALTAIVGL